MGVMKRNLLFAIILSAFIAYPAIAEVTVEETTDTEYLINAGYSQQTVEDVFMQKNRVSGKPVEPLYEKKHNRWANFYKRVFGYIDPSIDNADRLHHDVAPSPSFSDL